MPKRGKHARAYTWFDTFWFLYRFVLIYLFMMVALVAFLMWGLG